MTEPTPAKKVVVRTPLTPTENKQRKQVRVRVRETENLLCIGSENWYNSFWWKMMFIGAAFVGARSMRRADRQTLAYVDRGYTRYEKLAIENLAAERGFTTTAIGSSSALLGLLNRDRGNTALLDVMFFSHGTPGYISLNFYGTPSVDLSSANLRSVVPTAFAPNGRIFSYACRTGVAVDDEEFEREADAEPESSLAQRLADHFQIEVHAHLRRTLYRSVLRAPGTSDALVASLNAARPAQDGRVIQLPPDHEALPHPDLGRSYNPFRQGPRSEGTADYALWRKQGGLALPVSDSTPSGVGAGLRVFRPQS